VGRRISPLTFTLPGPNQMITPPHPLTHSPTHVPCAISSTTCPTMPATPTPLPAPAAAAAAAAAMGARRRCLGGCCCGALLLLLSCCNRRANRWGCRLWERLASAVVARRLMRGRVYVRVRMRGNLEGMSVSMSHTPRTRLINRASVPSPHSSRCPLVPLLLHALPPAAAATYTTTTTAGQIARRIPNPNINDTTHAPGGGGGGGRALVGEEEEEGEKEEGEERPPALTLHDGAEQCEGAAHGCCWLALTVRSLRRRRKGVRAAAVVVFVPALPVRALVCVCAGVG
jgi:hypothetical protein